MDAIGFQHQLVAREVGGYNPYCCLIFLNVLMATPRPRAAAVIELYFARALRTRLFDIAMGILPRF